MITAKLDERALNRYFKTLDKNRGRPLLTRAERVINAAAKLAVPALKAAAPKGPRHRQAQGPIMMLGRKRRKTLASSAGTKRLRKRGGEVIAPTWIGYKAFTAGWIIWGTKGHSLATRNLVGTAVRTTGGQMTRFGRWTKRGNYRSGFAHFADGEVRPLAGIYVSGITGSPLVDTVWDRESKTVYFRIEKGVFDTKS